MRSLMRSGSDLGSRAKTSCLPWCLQLTLGDATTGSKLTPRVRRHSLWKESSGTGTLTTPVQPKCSDSSPYQITTPSRTAPSSSITIQIKSSMCPGRPTSKGNVSSSTRKTEDGIRDGTSFANPRESSSRAPSMGCAWTLRGSAGTTEPRSSNGSRREGSINNGLPSLVAMESTSLDLAMNLHCFWQSGSRRKMMLPSWKPATSRTRACTGEYREPSPDHISIILY